LSFKYSPSLFLKFLPAFHLTLLKLSSFISLGSCNHCHLAHFLQSTSSENSSWFMMLLFTITGILFGRNFDVLSNSVPCPTDVPITYKFSTAANLFVIVTWYCSLLLHSFNFLRLILHIHFCAAHFLITSLSLIFATINSGQYHKQPLWKIEHQVYLTPSPIYKDAINLVVHLSLRRGPGVFMNTPVRSKFLDAATFTTLNLLL
jgi:hypothetical protein